MDVRLILVFEKDYFLVFEKDYFLVLEKETIMRWGNEICSKVRGYVRKKLSLVCIIKP